MMKLSLGYVLAISSLALSSPPVAAQDAPWGCEILLCAASSNPSWKGVPYCIPPMTKLIAAMKLPGFTWPNCPQAGTGKPGYEPYEDCPVGYLPYKDLDRNGELCKKPDKCQGYGDNRLCDTGEIIARPVKKDPYFFDIPNSENQSQRHWFNLTY